MSALHPNPEEEREESRRIISPFAQTTSTVQNTGPKGDVPWALWIVSILLVLVILGVVGYFVRGYLTDPYRTLKPFPVDDYLSDYHSLSGEKFQADLKVSADLGWKAETGRLMVFTVGSGSHPVVVLIPPKLSGIYFDKGQTYQAALEVGEGGLIYADSCEKR